MSRRLLLTGASGNIGRTIRPALIEAGYEVVGFDRRENPEHPDDFVGELGDQAAVSRACQGVQSVVHLAAIPYVTASFEDLLEPNIIGVQHVLEQSAACGVKRVVLASSVHASFGLEAPGRAADRIAAMSWYGVSKGFAEIAGRMFASSQGLEVVAARIGWFVYADRDAHSLLRHGYQSWYLSLRDTRRFFLRALEADLSGLDPAYVTAFAISRPQEGEPAPFDLEPSKRLLGYEPQDRFPEGAEHLLPPESSQASSA